MTTKLESAESKVCWDCTVQRPESHMVKGVDCGFTVWRCGCDKAEPPFMTAVAGHVMIHHRITGATLGENWTGICVSGDNNKAFWYIGFDGGERSYQKLPVCVTTLQAAKVLIEKQRSDADQFKAHELQSMKIWKTLENVRAVICVETPAGFNPAWIIMNAPRPLLGDRVIEVGEFNHGRFYAGIDPNVEFAESLVTRNLRDDARIVFVASHEFQQEMALELVPLEYRSRYKSKDQEARNNALSSYLGKLKTEKTLIELQESARATTNRLVEDSLIQLPCENRYW